MKTGPSPSNRNRAVVRKQGDSPNRILSPPVTEHDWWLNPSKRHSVVAFFAVLILPAILCAATLRLEGERAWLRAEDVPLAKVLELFEQRGVKVLLDPALSQQRISGTWENARVDRLIAQLAKPNSSMIEWRKEKSPLGELFQLSSIRIYSKGKPSLVPPVSSREKVLEVVRGENGIQYVRGEIMVGFSQIATIDDLQTLLSRLNGTVIEVIDPPGLYRIKLNDDMSVEEALRIAQEHGGVSAVEPNLALEKIANRALPSAAADMEINLNLVPGETAIAVLDSGLDPAYLDSPFIRGAYNALDPSAEISDPTGHGTLTSLIAAGAITPLGAKTPENGVPVLSIRTFDKNGVTSLDTLLRALVYAGNAGVKIVSMSWGSEVNSHILETAIKFAGQKGLTLYAAAGNEATGTPVYPAGYDSVIAVGGLNPDGSQWENSNYGEFVEHYEPALAIFNGQIFAGTSIASPYAAFKAVQEEAK